MTPLMLMLAAALLSIAPTIVLGQPLRYLGRAPETRGGTIALGDRAYDDIRPGMDIPGWGRVKEVRDDRIVIERARTDAEKEAMARRGALPHDILEVHVLRDDWREGPADSAGTRR